MIEDVLRTFIVDELWAIAPEALTDEYPLIERSILDSIGVLHVVAFVQSEFGVEIADDEIDATHFGTISSIARLVTTKLGD